MDLGFWTKPLCSPSDLVNETLPRGRRVVGQRFGFLVAAAFRTALANTVSGQNGFLTAALTGGTLALSRGELAAIALILGYAKTCLDADLLRR
jgi:hypothetical protein